MSKPANGPKRPETKVVQAGRSPFDHHGLVNPPVYHASTMLHPTMEVLESRNQPYTYGRRATPTIRALEKVGLAWDVKLPDSGQMARRRLSAEA